MASGCRTRRRFTLWIGKRLLDVVARQAVLANAPRVDRVPLDHPDGRPSQAAFGVLLDALALAAWCIVHGLAVLVLDGPPLELLIPSGDSAIERLAETVTDTLATGLAAHR